MDTLKIAAVRILLMYDLIGILYEYIQTKVIEVAKERIFDHSKSISQIAYESGFKYAQHFTRTFKQRVGQSPNEYRMLN